MYIASAPTRLCYIILYCYYLLQVGRTYTRLLYTDDTENCLEKVCCTVATDTNGAIKKKPNKRELLSRVNTIYIIVVVVIVLFLLPVYYIIYIYIAR